VQACLVLVLAPILEADFTPVSDGFRPRRRAHDAIAEIHPFGTKGYQWVLDADVEACFDNIAHSTVLERMRRRIADKRVLALSQAFVKAGIMSADGETRDTNTGTSQRRDRLCAAGQHRLVWAGRTFLRQVGRSRQQAAGSRRETDSAPQTRGRHLSDRRLCGSMPSSA
jgi:hypothetical protein